MVVNCDVDGDVSKVSCTRLVVKKAIATNCLSKMSFGSSFAFYSTNKAQDGLQSPMRPSKVRADTT